MLLKLFITTINFVIKSFGGLIRLLLSLLPDSPFLIIENFRIDYLDSLNWILQVSFAITVLMYWVGAIAIYYLVQIPLRWSKSIQ